MTGATIPEGEGTLLTLTFNNPDSSIETCFTNNVISNAVGQGLDFSVGCIDLVEDSPPELEADVYTWISDDSGETMEISFYHPVT